MGEISDIFENKIVNFYCTRPLGEMTSSISLFYELIVKAGLPASLGPCPLLPFPQRISPSWYQTLSSGSRKNTKIHIQVECSFEGAPGGHQCPQSHMQMHLEQDL